MAPAAFYDNDKTKRAPPSSASKGLLALLAAVALLYALNSRGGPEHHGAHLGGDLNAGANAKPKTTEAFLAAGTRAASATKAPAGAATEVQVAAKEMQEGSQPLGTPPAPPAHLHHRETGVETAFPEPFPPLAATTPGLVEQCSVRDCFPPEKAVLCRSCRQDPRPADYRPAEVPEGWAPDVTKLRRWAIRGHDDAGNVWPPPLSDEYCEAIGDFGGRADGNKIALEAMSIRSQPALPPRPGAVKLMCTVYTTADRHATSVRAQRETWGSDCDGFIVFSTEADPAIPAVVVEFPGKEEYNNIWAKVQAIWRYVYEHYGSDFDFFHIGGDDLFVVAQNMRDYLSTIGDPEDLHFHGRRFKTGRLVFNSGGAGYVLSRAALKLLVDSFSDARCHATRTTSMEDVMVAECLRAVAELVPQDTRDAQGRERFHPFAPSNHFYWKPSKDGSDWYERYNAEWGIKQGADCCAPDSVAFHYLKKPAMQRHIHALIHQCRRREEASVLST